MYVLMCNHNTFNLSLDRMFSVKIYKENKPVVVVKISCYHPVSINKYLLNV